MGAWSRQKGAAGEREVVALAKEAGFARAERSAPMQAGHADAHADVANVGRLRLEVRLRGKTTGGKRLYAMAVEACAERPGEIPVLAYRQDRGPWLAVLPLAELLKLERDALRAPPGTTAWGDALEPSASPPAGKDLGAGPA